MLPQQPARVTRRKETRYQCGPATFSTLSIYRDDEPQHAWIENLSASGIGLLLDVAIEPETFLVIHLGSEGNGAVFDLVARVTHCTPRNNGEWLIGCELADKLSQEDMDALL